MIVKILLGLGMAVYNLIIIFGIPFIPASIFRFFLHVADYDSDKARSIFFKQYFILAFAWFIYILLTWGI